MVLVLRFLTRGEISSHSYWSFIVWGYHGILIVVWLSGIVLYTSLCSGTCASRPDQWDIFIGRDTLHTTITQWIVSGTDASPGAKPGLVKLCMWQQMWNTHYIMYSAHWTRVQEEAEWCLWAQVHLHMTWCVPNGQCTNFRVLKIAS